MMATTEIPLSRKNKAMKGKARFIGLAPVEGLVTLQKNVCLEVQPAGAPVSLRMGRPADSI
jgi:hypothetical protein